MSTKEFNKILNEKYGCAVSDFWKTSGNDPKWIVRSSALKRIADEQAIRVEYPLVKLVEMAGQPYAYVLAKGTIIRDDQCQYEFTSTGEGGGLNLKSQVAKEFPLAMAEKRARDRVIILCLGLEGLYSESESEEFKAEEKPLEVKITSVKDGE